MSTTDPFDQQSSARPSSAWSREGGEYQLLAALAREGWQPAIEAARERGHGVRVTLRHPHYGECALEGASVRDVVEPLLELVRGRERVNEGQMRDLDAELVHIDAELAHTLRALVHGGGLADDAGRLAELVRAAARREVATLCGLVLRRLEDEASLGDELLVAGAQAIFGEALREFATGQEPAS